MPVTVALLRAVNVGGANRVAMSDLRALLSDLGFSDVQSLLQSGNLLFAGAKSTGEALERRLEKATVARLGLSVDYVVRSGTQWRSVVEQNPFAPEAARDPGKVVAMFLKQAPAKKSVETLRGAIVGSERVHCHDKQLYVVYPDGIGSSKLTGTLIEKHLQTRGTARNWKTVLKIAALCT